MNVNPEKKRVSCRLIAHQDSGRVRWCVGQERKWQKVLKRLALVPLILLPVVIVVILVAKHTFGGKGNTNSQNFFAEISNVTLSEQI
ncbi:unnamed protein product [Ceutorhynchus assimilis]|uniref:Uncharacterized protein n=1 Tax=Ceutorhynchus assimilis TaxID=467358 RepID=A0A9N9M8L7_9CUCU|nr:unnamed protein product [Ceutorhynchus assimilis]